MVEKEWLEVLDLATPKALTLMLALEMALAMALMPARAVVVQARLCRGHLRVAGTSVDAGTDAVAYDGTACWETYSQFKVLFYVHIERKPFYHPFYHPNYDELPVISLLENNHLLKPNSIEPTIGQVCLPGRPPAGRSSNIIL
jgi:hypothetical protein